MAFNFEKLNQTINNAKELNQDDIIVRKLLNKCAGENEIDMDLLDELSSKHFLMAYSIIKKCDSVNTAEELTDMIKAEYILTNTSSAEEIDDDEEVY